MSDPYQASRASPRPGVGSWPELPEPLPSPVPDSHCHLDIAYDVGKHGPGLSVDEALRQSAAVGVTRVVQVGYDVASSRFGVEVATKHRQVVAAVALHPNEAPRLAASGTFDEAFAEIDALAADERVVAIGETGLDHFRTGPEGLHAQEESFRRHIALAKALGKTLVIHDRDAHDDVIRVLHGEGAPDRVVFHCFSGGTELAAQCAEHGWFMSFAGPVTFKANDHLREALAVAPADLLLVETDAPFLAPLPHRGRPNASYLIPVTLRAMAQVRGVAIEELARTVTVNTERAFSPW
ncbi:MAG: TatD family hydrolase [Actinomycetia bacterium]|nr:TatD family hydrolase [Actinomycetes bacterium]